MFVTGEDLTESPFRFLVLFQLKIRMSDPVECVITVYIFRKTFHVVFEDSDGRFMLTLDDFVHALVVDFFNSRVPDKDDRIFWF